MSSAESPGLGRRQRGDVELLHAFLASPEFSFGFRPAAELLDGAVVLGPEPLLQRLRLPSFASAAKRLPRAEQG